eukprot:jgi/Galph1/5445/GphlegSOOS_G4068.1
MSTSDATKTTRRLSLSGSVDQGLPGATSFSEAELLDSGMSRSTSMELPSLKISDQREEDETVNSEVLLNKIQNLQLQLAETRELKVRWVFAKAFWILDMIRLPTLEKMTANLLANGSHVSENLLKALSSKSRIFVVSNRLPVNVDWSTTNNPTITISSGGLVPAVFYLKKKLPVYWFGSLGFAVDGDKQALLKQKLEKEYGFIPIFSNEIDYQLHQSFCNFVIWPLFHYLPLSIEGERSFRPDAWEAYKRVNMDFVKAILEYHEEGDLIWVHDFHFLLMPKMIRQRCPHASIGFFLHTPFPSSEVYRILPTRRELVEGVLGSDLIGFHSFDYARHFLSVCTRLLGLDIRPTAVDNHGNQVTVGIFPLGIDTTIFSKALATHTVQQLVEQWRQEYKGKKIIIGVDRLDYIKGIPQKLLAIEQFFETFPEWRGKCIFLQVAIPSTSSSYEYQRFRAEIHEMVGRLNGKFSCLDYVPIHFFHQMISFEELCALYVVGDVAIISSLRDGMNLVSYEYIYCQQHSHGVLILSEMTGAAHSLPGAILCNPWNTEEVAECIYKALSMTEQERKLKLQKLYRYVVSHTSLSWCDNYLTDLLRTVTERQQVQIQLRSLPMEIVKDAYESSDCRLFLLDYDGTLSKYRTLPELARPDARLKNVINQLSSHPKNILFIVSGRDKRTIGNWLGTTGAGLAAEYGFYYVWPKKIENMNTDSWHTEENGHLIEEWKTLNSEELSLDEIQKGLIKANKILKRFEDCTPGSFISEKETSITWHFRDADPDFSFSQAMEARQHLEQALLETPLEVLMGHKILYVRPKGVDKGYFAKFLLERLSKAPDFILSLGDDRTDEQMFEVFTCTVGRKQTKAHYVLEDAQDVLRILERLANE